MNRIFAWDTVLVSLLASSSFLGAVGMGVEGGPRRPLDAEEKERWTEGRNLFLHEFTAEEGLGSPGFNATSCAACHSSPVLGGAGTETANVDGNHGGYLGFAIAKRNPGADPIPLRKDFLDGLARASNDEERRTALQGTLQSPSLLGLGLIDGIDKSEILARVDPGDANGDGIRGRAGREDLGPAGTRIGRFGWRAQSATLEDFVRSACLAELGLTVPHFADGDRVSDPEMTQAQVDAMVFYCSQLAPPPRRGHGDEPQVRRGEELFAEIGCATCHVPSMPGADGPVPLYSDLLLHAVVEDLEHLFRNAGMLACGWPRKEPEPQPVWLRTPPLWGVSRTAPYLHDGRAETLEQAVREHRGEAERARAAFEELEASDREAVIAFLEDL